MSWITVIWSATAAICLTLAGVHFLVWVKSRESLANLLFSISAVSAAVCAGFELALMHAQTPAQLGEVLRWFHVPVGLMVVSLVWFVRFYLGTGRLWLAWLICGLRVVTLVLTFSLHPNLNFREITGLHSLSVWGEVVVSPIGVKNPWTNITHASGILLLVFVIDAGITAWRKGNRQRAWLVTATFGVAIVTGLTLSELLNRGVLPVPFTLSLVFLVIVAGMASELSMDLLNANRLARELRENQERLSLATKAANVGVWEWDVIRDEIWVTDTIRSDFGLGENERQNLDRFLQSVHPDDREAARKAVCLALEPGNELRAEYRLIYASGEVRWIAARGQVERGADGKPLRIRGVSVDITERHQREEVLRESEERFRHVADTAPVLIWMAGTDKLCDYFNKGWLNYTGRSLEQELGNGWAEGVHPDDFQRCLDIYTTSFDARREFTMQYRLRKQNGEYGWVLDIGVPRFAADGQFLGYIGSCVDITSQQEAEELRREVAHFQRVSATGQLATTLAHELNQPLGAILRNAEAAELFLQQDPPDLEELRAILTDIKSDDQRAGAVIDRMRSLLKKRDLRFEPLGLKELVDQVAALVRGQIKMHHATFEIDLPDGLPPVRGDRVQLQQVLLNLLMNGLDALDGLPLERQRLSLTAHSAEPQTLEVAVSDRGRGIPAEKLSDIFKPFSTTKPRGLGMGLAISQTIIAAHGGRIWAENNPAGGATFRFTLKVASGEELVASDERTAPSTRHSPSATNSSYERKS